MKGWELNMLLGFVMLSRVVSDNYCIVAACYFFVTSGVMLYIEMRYRK